MSSFDKKSACDISILPLLWETLFCIVYFQREFDRYSSNPLKLKEKPITELLPQQKNLK